MEHYVGCGQSSEGFELFQVQFYVPGSRSRNLVPFGGIGVGAGYEPTIMHGFTEFGEQARLNPVF